LVSQAEQCAQACCSCDRESIPPSIHRYSERKRERERSKEREKRKGCKLAMSEESRRSGVSIAALRSSDDRKSLSSTSSAASPAAPVAPDLKITLKSADMKEEMRQEAFDCARAVIIPL
jgi:hypothetical protein